MRVGLALPHRAKRPHASHAPPTALGPKAILLENLEEVRTKILYFNSESVHANYGDIIRQRGHNLAAASSRADALAMMRGHLFDALVMDCELDTLDVQDFTAKAQGLQPSLAVFLADEWGDELVTGLGEFEHVLTMLEDDECARLAAESRIRLMPNDSARVRESMNSAT